MIQEELEHNVVLVLKDTGKLTADVLKAAIRKTFIEPRQEHKQTTAHRKQLVKDERLRDRMRRKEQRKEHIAHGEIEIRELLARGRGVVSHDVQNDDVPLFRKTAKAYGFDYAVRRDETSGLSQIFYQPQDSDAVDAAYKAFSDALIKQHRRKNQRKAIPTNLKSVENIASAEGAGFEKIAVTKDNIGDFKKVAGKYNVRYSAYKVKDEDTYYVFFKSRNSQMLMNAFKAYLQDKSQVKHTPEQKRVPLKERLRYAEREMVKRKKTAPIRSKEPNVKQR